MEELRHNTLQM